MFQRKGRLKKAQVGSQQEERHPFKANRRKLQFGNQNGWDQCEAIQLQPRVRHFEPSTLWTYVVEDMTYAIAMACRGIFIFCNKHEFPLKMYTIGQVYSLQPIHLKAK